MSLGIRADLIQLGQAHQGTVDLFAGCMTGACVLGLVL